jgi:hypothetical protein
VNHRRAKIRRPDVRGFDLWIDNENTTSADTRRSLTLLLFRHRALLWLARLNFAPARLICQARELPI